jgi:RNA polymerase sigma-70 factor (ECF subfamily)
LQDTFLQAYLSLHQFEGRSTIYSWLTRIGINSALTILRKRRNRREVLFDPTEKPTEDSPHFDLKDAAASPEEMSDRRQRRSRLLHAIRNLQPSLRTPVLMQILQGWSIKQIGQALGMVSMVMSMSLSSCRATSPYTAHSIARVMPR